MKNYEYIIKTPDGDEFDISFYSNLPPNNDELLKQVALNLNIDKIKSYAIREHKEKYTIKYEIYKKKQKKTINNKIRKSVFISYSQKDSKHLERLQIHLRPLVRDGLINLWDDTKINTGDDWKNEILTALDEADIAVLIISANFLASDFIVDDELPPLLEKARSGGTRILPVILSPCRFTRDKNLSIYQSLNPPEEPITKLNEHDQEEIWDRLSDEIDKV